MARHRLQPLVEQVLDNYRGRVVTPTAVMLELGELDTAMTRETVRKWITEYGCTPLVKGHYRVPRLEPELRESKRSRKRGRLDEGMETAAVV